MVFSFTLEVDLTSSLDFGSLYVFEFICISGSWLLVFVLSLCLSCESLPCPLCLFALFIPSLSHISFLFVSPLPVSLFLLNLSCLLIPILVSVRVFVLLPVLFCHPCLMCIVSSFASPVMLCLICPSGVLMHLHFPCMSPHVYMLCLFPFVPCQIFCLSPSSMLSLC